jgi:hypothetical protein
MHSVAWPQATCRLIASGRRVAGGKPETFDSRNG